MSQLRKLAKDLLVYGWGEILLKASLLITLPLYTRVLSPADYGTWSYVTTLAGLVAAILALGGDSAYSRLFHETKTESERQELTSTWLAFLAAWCFGVLLLFLPLIGPLSSWALGTDPHAAQILALAMLAVPVTLINGTCAQVLRNRFQARAFVNLNVLSTLLSLGFSLTAAMVLKLGVPGILGGALLGALVMLPVRLYTVRDVLRPRFSLRVLGEFLRYGLPLVPASLAYWVFSASDRVMLGKLTTLDQVGLYAVALQLASVFNLVIGAIGQAWGPFAIRLHEDDPEAATGFFGQVMTYLLMGFGFLCVMLTAFAPELLRLVTTPAFYGAAVAVGPLALAMTAFASTQVTALGISLTKKTGYLALFSWGAALLNVLLNLLLMPRWGMLGASVAMAAAYTFLTLAYGFQSQRLMPIRYEARRALVAIAVTLGLTLLLSWLSLPVSWLGGAFKLGTGVAFLVLLVLLGALDRREWTLVRKLWQGARQAPATPTP
ncbi:Polysaccharide biosynthesis protein [compost metagenome]